MVLKPSSEEGKDLVIETIPEWVAAWVGERSENLLGKPVRKVFAEIAERIVTVAEEVYESGRPIEECCMEVSDRNGREWAVLMEAGRETVNGANHDAAGARVILHLTDVTETVAAHRDAIHRKSYHGIIGQSPAILQVYHKIEVYGPSDGPVVITGETGTGKELVARALHQKSPRKDKPFVAVNCCALSEELFESELFGHERGSFTGAMRTHRGRFERAHEGTLFLDEIGDMAPRIQAKLLRVLEDSKLERVGGEREIPVDVRVIAATNTSLDRAVALGRFRADLFHRLAVFRVHIPPLRDRTGDIPLLVEHFLESFNERYNRRVERLSPDAMKVLMDYYWPGNIRELRNVLERVYVETRGNVIGRKVLETWERERDSFIPGGWNLQDLETLRMQTPPVVPPWIGERAALPAPNGGGKVAPPASYAHRFFRPSFSENPGAPIDAVYRVVSQPKVKQTEISEEMIRTAYREAKGNLAQVARSLGVHKATLYRRMKTLGLTRENLH